MKLKDYIRLIIVLLLCNSVLFAQVGITPRILELDNSDISKSHSFKLLNLSKEELHISVAVENWQMTNANQPIIIAPTETSLDQWIIVNPLTFTIPADSSQTVRIAFFPPSTLLAGEYRTMIYFNQVIQAKEKKGLIRSKFKLGAAVYLQIEDKQPQGEILSIWHKDKNIMLDINNQGNTHIRYAGNWSLWQTSHYPSADSIAKLNLHKDSVTKIDGLLEVGKLPGNSILPGNKRTISFPVDYLSNEDKQKLTLHIDGHMAGVKIIKTYTIDI